MRHGASPSAGDLSPAILTHGTAVRTAVLDDPVDPVSALSALSGRERPALVRHGGAMIRDDGSGPSRIGPGRGWMWGLLAASVRYHSGAPAFEAVPGD